MAGTQNTASAGGNSHSLSSAYDRQISAGRSRPEQRAEIAAAIDIAHRWW
jgi:hypothetical protein